MFKPLPPEYLACSTKHEQAYSKNDERRRWIRSVQCWLIPWSICEYRWIIQSYPDIVVSYKPEFYWIKCSATCSLVQLLVDSKKWDSELEFS